MTPYQTNPHTPIDRILVSILQKRLKSITEEMSIAMTRTTRSPILCEARDFVTGLYDYKGDMLEQKENLPILAFSLQPVCKYIIEYFGDDIHEGDVIFHNDVFSMGNQNNDVAVYKPIFWEGELVAWSAVKGHQADIGGNVRGGYNPKATEVWQESPAHPPGEGVRPRGLCARTSGTSSSPTSAWTSWPRTCAPRSAAAWWASAASTSILERYGREVFEAHKEFLFDSTEQMMRTEIRSIPEGVYTGESYAYYDGKIPGSQVQDLRHDHGERRLASPSTTRHRPPDQRVRQRHLLLVAPRPPSDPAADGEPRHPPQRGSGAPRRHHHPRGHHPERRLPGGHHLRQPPLPQQRRRHHARAGAGDPRAGDRRVERGPHQP